MTLPSQQLAFELPHRPALDAQNFLVSTSNGAAVDLIDRWPCWETASALVVGPRSAGKSHLANVWRLRSGAAVVRGEELCEAVIPLLTDRRALVVEDIDQGVAGERILFHALNVAREQQCSLLLTSTRPPGEMEIGLPDLRSRLRALPVMAIEAPDEGLLHAVLIKLFADRQLAVEPHVIAYLTRNMERSMAFAAQLVDEVDREALASHRRVSRALAADVLARLGDPKAS